MRIGVDFDNTIVCYDQVFHQVAVEQHLIPASTPINKTAVRNHLRGAGNEAAWTRLQGEIYGPHMNRAAPFPAVEAFFARCTALHIPLFIISHRTRHPYTGEKHDLHEAAKNWLRARRFVGTDDHALAEDHVFFELTKEDKLARIAQTGVTHFIDDLPEFLLLPDFPPGVQRILFDAGGTTAPIASIVTTKSWDDLARLLLEPEARR